MRSYLRVLTAAVATSLAVSMTACEDATSPVSPEGASHGADVEKDASFALRRDLRSYPARVLADFETEYSLPQSDQSRGLTYEWSFDGGARQVGAKVTHAFTSTGSHDVSVRVTDASGTTSIVTKTVSVTPSIAALNNVMVGVVPGGLSTCAVDASSSVYCWGSNATGIVGDGTNVTRLLPTPVQTGAIAFSQIAAGSKHSCALSTSGAAYCWGRNSSGQLGDGTQADRMLPTLVLGGLAFTTIDVGVSHTCAVTDTGDRHRGTRREYRAGA